MGGEPVSFEQPVINENIEPPVSVAQPEAVAGDFSDPVTSFLENHGNEFTTDHEGNLITYYQAVENCPALPMMIQALGEGALALTAAVHEVPEAAAEKKPEEPEEAKKEAPAEKDGQQDAERQPDSPEAEADPGSEEAAARSENTAETEMVSVETANPGPANSHGSSPVTTGEKSSADTSSRSDMSTGTGSPAEAAPADEKDEPEPVISQPVTPKAVNVETAVAGRLPDKETVAKEVAMPAVDSLDAAPEAPVETRLTGRAPAVPANAPAERNQPIIEGLEDVDDVADLDQETAQTSAEADPLPEPAELAIDSDEADAEAEFDAEDVVAAEANDSDVIENEFVEAETDTEEELWAASAEDADELLSEEEFQLAVDELLAGQIEHGGASIVEEEPLTTEADLAEAEMETLAQTEQAVLTLADRIAEAGGEEAAEVQHLMDEIVQKVTEIQGEDAVTTLIEAEADGDVAEAEKELTELFEELFERVGMEYTPELTETLVRLVLRQDIAGVIKEFGEDNESPAQDRGTHEIISRLLAASVVMKKMLAHACSIGKSALSSLLAVAPSTDAPVADGL